MKMKRFLNHFLSMSIIASLLVVTSCGDDAEDDPIIGNPSFTITGVDEGQETETDVNVGETVSFTVDVEVPAGFNTFVVNQTVGGTTTEYDREARPSGTPATSHSYDFSYTPNQDVAGESVIFDFIVVDDEGRETDYTYTVNVNERQVTEYNAVLLAAPTGEEPNSRSESFFSSINGETYSVEEVNQSQDPISATIDFGYFYGSGANDTRATIASPADYPFQSLPGFENWTVKNDTKIKPTNLTESEFVESGNNAEFIVSTFNDAEYSTENEFVTEGRINRLSEGDVLAFMTDPANEEDGVSRHGLILINSISGEATSEGQISISVKVTD